MIPPSRLKALAAIAEASGRAPDANVDDDLQAGITTLRSPGFEPLRLIEGDIVTSPGLWQFDVAPAHVPDTAPAWHGYLAVPAENGSMVAIALSDRFALADAWPELAERLASFELASLIARYFGRDAGLPVHHTAIAQRADAERLLANPADLPEKVAPPRLSEPRATDGLVTLSFFTSFIEPDDEGAPHVGLAYWKARWAPDNPLAWDSLVIARHLRSWLSR
jgi:hypothetical protein